MSTSGVPLSAAPGKICPDVRSSTASSGHEVTHRENGIHSDSSTPSAGMSDSLASTTRTLSAAITDASTVATAQSTAATTPQSGRSEGVPSDKENMSQPKTTTDVVPRSQGDKLYPGIRESTRLESNTTKTGSVRMADRSSSDSSAGYGAGRVSGNYLNMFFLRPSTRQFIELDGTHDHNLANRIRLGSSNRIRNFSLRRKLRVSSEKLVVHTLGTLSNRAFPSDAEYPYGRTVAIKRKIGSGTFGKIYLVETNSAVWNDRLHVFKVLKKRADETESEFNRRTAKEFLFGNQVDHENTLRILDYIELDIGRCQVMEFCRGGDLYTLIKTTGPLKQKEADCLFKQLLRGVAYLYSEGIAHRDLKPENLLLTERGVLKIADFGTSEGFSGDSRVWGQRGSLPYIAPEGFDPTCESEGCIPPALDVWSCGIIYLVMLYGRILWWCANPDRQSDRGGTSSGRRPVDDDSFDPNYLEYIEARKTEKGYKDIHNLTPECRRNLIYSILDPSAARRISAHRALRTSWVRSISCCTVNPTEAKMKS